MQNSRPHFEKSQDPVILILDCTNFVHEKNAALIENDLKGVTIF